MPMPPSREIEFSVVIVNYNGAEFLPACLDSLKFQTFSPDLFETILVDNFSTDGSAQLVRGQYPWVRILPLSRNIGFAEGNNIAIAEARGRVIVLLNTDTIADPFWLEELSRSIGENPGCVIGSKLLMESDPAIINSAGLCLLRDGRGADRAFGSRDRGQFEAGGEIFAACAAAVAIPRELLRSPHFDPTYFLYCEDLEEGWAGQLAGRRTVLAPRAVVRHRVGASGGDRSPLFWYCVERNRTITAVRHADPFLAAYSLLGLFARVTRASALFCLRHPAPKYRRANVFAVWRALGAVLRRLPELLAERSEAALQRSN